MIGNLEDRINNLFAEGLHGIRGQPDSLIP